MSAINGDIDFVMMTVSRRAIVTRPRTASIVSLSRFSFVSAGLFRRTYAEESMIRQLNLFDISNNTNLWTSACDRCVLS